MVLTWSNILNAKNDLITYPSNKYEFMSKPENGYSCYIERNGLGVWCGYVTIPKGHPYWWLNRDEINENINVHGKVTYSKDYTFGFDCGHKGDYKPKCGYGTKNSVHAVYWTADMAMKETISMAMQFEVAMI